MHYLAGPVIAVLVIGLLGLVLRWIFGSGQASTRAGGADSAAASRDEDGLLQPVAAPPDRAAGNALRALLSDAGIRSTLRTRRDGRVEVLVFAEDAERARRLLPPPIGTG